MVEKIYDNDGNLIHMNVTMCNVNGQGRKGKKPPREVLERNVMDMLEDNDYYWNLDFDEAQTVVDAASYDELILIYAEELAPERVAAILNNA